MAQEPMLLDTLNERELEIIPLLAERLSNKEIANQLFLAPNTVKWYVKQLNSKLDTSNRHEIVDRANELGLLDKQTDDTRYSRPRQNLPRQTTPFIGRDTELDEIHKIIEKEDVRLLTILAQGGMGKTRVALEATEQQLNHFPDGVYFVPLQALSDVNNIVPQIATSTGFQFSNDGRSQREQLLNFLANKSMLLCIDNWEHLLDGVDLINEILQSAPDVKILATSREKLNLMSETVYVLQGMNYPDWETADDALEYDAVQLLVQSAQRVKPDWEITQDNLDDVARVCRLTQGMPLGILLTTSWLDVYSLERICDEIQKSVDILETEMRDVPERQRSIRAVFEHTWKRLKPKEQAVLMKMSVFRDGATPQAVEAITGANARTLQSLVNKALLLRNREGRYDIHELLRQYAEVELKQSGEIDATRDAHMTYYAEVFYKLGLQLKNKGDLQTYNTFEIDIQNLKVILQRILEVQNVYLGTKIIDAIYFYWRVRREQFDITAYIKSLYDLSKKITGINEPNPISLARIQIFFASLCETNDEIAGKLLCDTLKVMRASGSQVELAECLALIAVRKNELGQYVEAFNLAEESHQIYLKEDDKWGIGFTHIIMGVSLQHFHNWTEAYYHQNQRLKIFSSIGNIFETAGAHFQLGYISLNQNNNEDAFKHMKLAYQGVRHINSETGIGAVMKCLASLYHMKGNFVEAEHYRNELLQQSYVNGTLWLICDALIGVALILTELGRFAEAEYYVRKSLNLVSETNYTNHRVLANTILSEILELKAEYQEAYDLIFDAHLEFKSTDTDFSNFMFDLKYRLASALCSLDRFDEALEYLRDCWYFKSTFPLAKLKTVSLFTQILAFRKQYERSVQLLSLVFNHQIQLQAIRQHPRLLELQKYLREELGEEVYTIEWKRGKSLDIQAVIQEMIDKFGEKKDNFQNNVK